jgi:hypothetical protein
MDITLKHVLDHGARWFDAVASGGSAAAQAAFFLHPNPLIYVLATGVAISLDDHHRVHAQWVDEVYHFGPFNLTVLSTLPSRVRARGTVYWQAEYAGRPAPNVIKAVVGEDWILERTAHGALKFVLYMNGFHHLLPDSAPFDL